MVRAPGEDMQRILCHRPDIGRGPGSSSTPDPAHDFDRRTGRRGGALARLRATTVLTVVLCVFAVLAGCTRSVDGRAVSVYDDPFKVAGLPTTSGPSGPREGVPDTTLTAVNGDGGEIDTLALNAVEDIETYWRVEDPQGRSEGRRGGRGGATLGAAALCERHEPV